MQMMQNLLVGEGDIVHLASARLPKGQLIKLQPHTKDFLDISNPKAVLETTLRSYSCLTVGDCIALHYNGRRYFIDVIEAKPAVSVLAKLLIGLTCMFLRGIGTACRNRPCQLFT